METECTDGLRVPLMLMDSVQQPTGTAVHQSKGRPAIGFSAPLTNFPTAELLGRLAEPLD